MASLLWHFLQKNSFQIQFAFTRAQFRETISLEWPGLWCYKQKQEQRGLSKQSLLQKRWLLSAELFLSDTLCLLIEGHTIHEAPICEEGPPWARQPRVEFQTELKPRKSAMVCLPHSCVTTILPMPHHLGISCNTQPLWMVLNNWSTNFVIKRRASSPLQWLDLAVQGEEQRGTNMGHSMGLVIGQHACSCLPYSSQSKSLKQTSHHIIPLVTIPQWLSIIHGMEIQICQLDSSLDRGGLPLGAPLPSCFWLVLPAGGIRGSFGTWKGMKGWFPAHPHQAFSLLVHIHQSWDSALTLVAFLNPAHIKTLSKRPNFHMPLVSCHTWPKMP